MHITPDTRRAIEEAYGVLKHFGVASSQIYHVPSWSVTCCVSILLRPGCVEWRNRRAWAFRASSRDLDTKAYSRA